MSSLVMTGLRQMSGLFWSGVGVRAGSLSGVCVESRRHNVRWHFEKPSEVKRVRKHGWITRISTTKGRNIIMRRILRGRHILSH